MSEIDIPKLVGSSQVPSLQIQANEFGAPGARMILRVIPQFEPSRRTDRQILADRTQRAFIVSAKLSKAPSPIAQIQGNFTHEDGDSFLAAPETAAKIRIDTLAGSFDVSKNAAGELSFVELRCEATDPDQARASFITVVYPALDHLAYVYNVRLLVLMIRVFDVVHQSTHIECVAPFWTKVLDNSASRLFVEMKPVYAMYREAKNSDSDFYRFLCFYKILEGLLGKMRADAVKRAKAAGIRVQIERDVVPGDEHLPPELKSHVGAPMKQFFDNVLTIKFRNAVAHLVTDEGVLHASDPRELSTYAGLAFITDICARALIANHERLLLQVSS